MSRIPDAIIYLTIFISMVCFAFFGVYFVTKKSVSIWCLFAGITFGLCTVFLYWQNDIWRVNNEAHKEPTANNHTIKKSHAKSIIPHEPSIQELEVPIFSEETDKVSISIGDRNSFTTYISSLKEKPQIPININGFIPIKLYYLENKIYADIEVYSNSGFPPIQIKKNKLINKPPNWDFNFNEKALEIVNEEQVPVYQYIYKTSSHIIINGTFSLPNNGVLSSNELSRIFKYPSWKYPREYEIENR